MLLRLISSTGVPGAQYKIDDMLNINTMLHLRENRRTSFPVIESANLTYQLINTL